jgi:hypothetical protein
MRLLHVSAIAAAAIALLASPLMRFRAETKDVPLPTRVQHRAPEMPELAVNGVEIVDELVTANIVGPPKARVLSPHRPAVRRAATPPRRSLLARVFFGSGDHKPHPFPHPAGEDVRTR